MAGNCTFKRELVEKILSQTEEPIAIFGNGVSGQGLQKLCLKLALKCVFYDQRPERGEIFTEESAKRHGIAICSPSFLSDHPWVDLARRNKLLCVSELDFASLWWDGPIVAITGTNGKTTITSFLTEIFIRCNFRAFSAVNIGQSLGELVALKTLKSTDLIFCEISSFQAESSQIIPLTHLIWSNFATNHLNMHRTGRKYFFAKHNLLVRLKGNGQIFCGRSVVQWAWKLRVPMSQEIQVVAAERDGSCTAFEDYPQRENLAIIEKFCAPYAIPLERVLGEAKRFQRPRFRLENLGIVRGNTYWNDSKCPNFLAVDCALKDFPNERVIWIGGGQSKGEHLPDIIPLLRGRIDSALLIGETGAALANLLQKYNIYALYVQPVERAMD
jgi:UDP-N-acetylmuramoylalanine--D-glutamate ligase